MTIPRTCFAERLVLLPTGLNTSSPLTGRCRRRVPSRCASPTVALIRRRQSVIGSLYQPCLLFAGPKDGELPDWVSLEREQS